MDWTGWMCNASKTLAVFKFIENSTSAFQIKKRYSRSACMIDVLVINVNIEIT